MTHDSVGAAARVSSSLQSTFEESCFNLYLKIADGCESPIEAMLGAAIVGMIKIAFIDGPSLQFLACFQDDYWNRKRKDSHILLIPQFKWKGYRIDWALSIPGVPQPWIFIECDGHGYHDLTKEQAQRDRKIQGANIPIIRFTGSEIFKDPAECAQEVVTFLADRLPRKAA